MNRWGKRCLALAVMLCICTAMARADDIPDWILEDWATPTAFPQTPEPVAGGWFESKNELKPVEARLKDRNATRSGPDTNYTEELGTISIDTPIVLYQTEQSRVGDVGWGMIEFVYRGTLVRAYTGTKGIDFFPEDVDHSDKTYTEAKMASSTKPYFGPGEQYRQHEYTLYADYEVRVCHDENDWALIDFVYPKKRSLRARGWVRVEQLSGYTATDEMIYVTPTPTPTPSPTPTPTPTPKPQRTPIGEATRDYGVQIGDSIKFGLYPQKSGEETEKEPIEWVVLAKGKKGALLISKYVLDCQPYHTSKKEVTWEKSSLRSWMNKKFYEAAFSEDEQKGILPTANINDDSQFFGTAGGKLTRDRVFALDLYEAEHYLNDENRMGEATNYAVYRGAITKKKDQYIYWWLRSPGKEQDYVATIFARKNEIDYEGNAVNFGRKTTTNVGVRPSIWLSWGYIGTHDLSGR